MGTQKPEQVRYISMWKCPSHEFSELLDNAGGPIPKAEVPNYAAYLKMLRDGMEQGIHDADFAVYLLMPMAEMRQHVQRLGLSWDMQGWATVASEVLGDIDAYAKRGYAEGRTPDLEERLQPVWNRTDGWLI